MCPRKLLKRQVRVFGLPIAIPQKDFSPATCWVTEGVFRMSVFGIGAGGEGIFTLVAALVDTNVLVYRFDDRFPDKQKIATEILRRGIEQDSVRIPHQAIVEFVAAVTRNIRGHIILKQADALR